MTTSGEEKGGEEEKEEGEEEGEGVSLEENIDAR